MENWQESSYFKASDEAAKFKYKEKHTLTDGSRVPDHTDCWKPLGKMM